MIYVSDTWWADSVWDPTQTRFSLAKANHTFQYQQGYIALNILKLTGPTRKAHTSHIRQQKKESLEKGFRYDDDKLWNELPSELQCSKSCLLLKTY